MTVRSKRKKKYPDKDRLLKILKVIFVIVWFILGLCRDQFFVEQYGNVEEVEYSFHFPDVGEGDCTIIASEEYCVMVDTGSRKGEYISGEYARSLADKVDCLVLTHPHEDHMGAMLNLMEVIEVETIMVPDIKATTPQYEYYLNDAMEKGVKIETANVGGIYSFGDITLQILGPLVEDESNVNNSSIVVRAVTEDVSVMITGDIERKAEMLLLGKYSDAALKSDILKVAHHGSATSSSEQFLDTVSPTYAVISCEWDNYYEHPSEQTLTRLKYRGIEYFITFEHGHVVFVSDGKNIALAQ